MKKRQVLFWRFFLISIILLGIFFIFQNKLGIINKDQLINIKDIKEYLYTDKSEKKEIKLNIRPNDFYKKKKGKN